MSGPVISQRASYRHGVRWIAHNDDCGGGASVAEIASYISTLLLADLFGADPERVALDIARERQRAGLAVATEEPTA